MPCDVAAGSRSLLCWLCRVCELEPAYSLPQFQHYSRSQWRRLYSQLQNLFDCGLLDGAAFMQEDVAERRWRSIRQGRVLEKPVEYDFFDLFEDDNDKKVEVKRPPKPEPRPVSRLLLDGVLPMKHAPSTINTVRIFFEEDTGSVFIIVIGPTVQVWHYSTRTTATARHHAVLVRDIDEGFHAASFASRIVLTGSATQIRAYAYGPAQSNAGKTVHQSFV